MLPNPWIILGAVLAFIGAAIAGYFYGVHVENLSWEAAIGKQKVEAANILTTATQKADAAALDNANLNTRIENENAQHQQKLSEANATIDQLAGTIDRLRDTGRRTSCSSPVPAAPRSTTITPGPATGNQPVAPGSLRDLAQIISGCLATAAYAEQCHDWAVNVGHPQ